jgi:KAP family P-loop domain
LWSDNETADDLLGFQVHADLVKSVVTDPSLLPVTVGLFGDWGGGKTSIMRMLQKSLESEDKIAVLYFNGWTFEGYDDAKSAIISSVLLELARHKRFGAKVRDGVTSLLKSVNWMRVARIGWQHVALPALAATITGGASLLPAVGTAAVEAGKSLLPKKPAEDDPKGAEDASASSTAPNFEGLLKDPKDNPQGAVDVRGFREGFEALLAKSEINALVVLVDDLDRCSPERIVDNLEAIKLFLNVERTAFVIGADPRIVRHAIRSRYRTGDIESNDTEKTSERLEDDYLEKLIQVPYRLPKLSPTEIETYMTLLFCARDLSGSVEQYSRVVTAFRAKHAENRYAAFGLEAVQEAIGTMPEELKNSLQFCASSSHLITDGLKGNPRQVKRFLNAFVLRKKLAQVARLEHIKDDVLVKLMVLEYTEAARFADLYEWQAAENGHPTRLNRLEASLQAAAGEAEFERLKKDVPGWLDDRVKRWLQMEPRLAEVDLRDYFWVSRDRLESPTTGLSLVSPLVRRLFDSLLNDTKQQPANAEAVKALASSERESLIDLLVAHINRKPRDANAYMAALSMYEARVEGALGLLERTFEEQRSGEIPPQLAARLVLLFRKPDFEAELAPILERLSRTANKLSKSIEAFLRKK